MIQGVKSIEGCRLLLLLLLLLFPDLASCFQTVVVVVTPWFSHLGILQINAPTSTNAFVGTWPSLVPTTTRRRSTTTTTTTTTTALQMADDINNTNNNNNNKRLSHAMLKVPSVQETVDYWLKYHHGRVIRSSSRNVDNGTLQGAFVVLGKQEQQQEHQHQQQQPFALELTTFRGKQLSSSSSSSSSLSPSIAYIGVSLLAPPLRPPTSDDDDDDKAASPTDAGTDTPTRDPNGIAVRKVASAPGDSLLARFCLYFKTKNLEEMQDFYTSVIGMNVKAVDETQLCLRFEQKNGGGTGGVPTTLIFEHDKDKTMEKDLCFDHLAIQVDNIDEEYKRIKHADCRMCMELTEMFGSKLFGVLDPSGYKVIFFGQS